MPKTKAKLGASVFFRVVLRTGKEVIVEADAWSISYGNVDAGLWFTLRGELVFMAPAGKWMYVVRTSAVPAAGA